MSGLENLFRDPRWAPQKGLVCAYSTAEYIKTSTAYTRMGILSMVHGARVVESFTSLQSLSFFVYFERKRRFINTFFACKMQRFPKTGKQFATKGVRFIHIKVRPFLCVCLKI